MLVVAVVVLLAALLVLVDLAVGALAVLAQ
jgi:hypothetical protein